MVCGSAVGRQIPVKFVRKRRNFLKFLVSMLPLCSFKQSETPYMFFAAFLLAITGLINGVEMFAGPLWAAKLQ